MGYTKTWIVKEWIVLVNVIKQSGGEIVQRANTSPPPLSPDDYGIH